MKVNKLTPNFEVSDIRQTVEFYTKNFDFKLIMAVPEKQDGIDEFLSQDKEYVYAMMSKDSVELMFQRSDTFKEDIIFSKNLSIGASVSFYIEIEGIVAFYEKIKDKSLKITELRTTWYGMQEFYVKDLNGYIIGFAEKKA